jgi:hypothetical protein
MASQLKVDTITGVTTAGSISVTGEGNSTTTNLQQGLVKAWANVDGTGTPALDDSFNCSGVADRGTGEYTLSYVSSMNNTVYAIPFGGKNPSVSSNYGGLGIAEGADRLTTGNIPFRLFFGNGTFGDYNELTVAIIGDLA